MDIKLIIEIIIIKNADNGSITKLIIPKILLKLIVDINCSLFDKTLNAGIKQKTEPIPAKIDKIIVLKFLLKPPAINPLSKRIIIPIKVAQILICTRSLSLACLRYLTSAHPSFRSILRPTPR